MARSKKIVKDAVPATRLLADLRGMIAEARVRVARSLDSTLLLLYWRLGRRIREDIFKEKRAAYGEEVVATLAQRLSAEFGRGFSRRNLFNMMRFAEVFPDLAIVQALTAQLGWTHFTLLLSLDDPLKREFYAEMCRVGRWSTRTLGKKIDSLLFERTALSRKPGKLIEQELKELRDEDRLTPDLVFRDHYLLDVLGLKNIHAEKDVEGSGIRVAAYWTEALPREQLEHKRHEIVALARRRLERVSDAVRERP